MPEATQTIEPLNSCLHVVWRNRNLHGVDDGVERGDRA